MVASALYAPPILCVKLSVLSLYRRLFPSKILKKALILVAIFVFSYSIAAVFTVVFQCYPIQANWDPAVSGRCIDFGSCVLAFGICNIVSDFTILALPLPVLWRLQVSRNQKWVLVGLFLSGGL